MSSLDQLNQIQQALTPFLSAIIVFAVAAMLAKLIQKFGD